MQNPGLSVSVYIFYNCQLSSMVLTVNTPNIDVLKLQYSYFLFLSQFKVCVCAHMCACMQVVTSVSDMPCFP